MNKNLAIEVVRVTDGDFLRGAIFFGGGRGRLCGCQTTSIWKMRILYLFFVLCCAIMPSSARAEIDGRALYLHWCSQCHGLEGRGDGVNSTPDMRINPRDHTDASYMSTRTDKQLEEVIKGGGISISKSAIMPPWSATLTDKEIKAVVLYLRKLCNCQFEGVLSDEKLRKTSPDFK